MKTTRWGYAALVLLGTLLGAVEAPAQPMPDLIFNANAINPFLSTETFAPTHCAVHEGCVVAGTRKLLRFRSESWNIGSADIVLGNPVGNPLFEFDACHNHYHFNGFADYRLVGPNGVVATGHKASFCLTDTYRQNPAANPQRVYNCSNQGIQWGWADVYTAELDCQWIDVTDVPPGHYTLELEVNPDGLLTESNYANNVASVGVDIPAPPTASPTPTATPLPTLSLNPIPSPIVIGQTNGLTGSGFTAGSVVKLFVASAAGVSAYGPFTPSTWSPTSLSWLPPSSIGLGKGFGTVRVINTDQGFIASNPQSQLLYGSAAANIPTLLSIDGQALEPARAGVPLAYAKVVIQPGAKVTLGGTGFNAPLVNLFSTAGNHGPLVPLPGGSASAFQVTIPNGVPTGPGTIQVVNSPYTGNVTSNTVALAIGAVVSLDGVSQMGNQVTVTGTGFSSLTVINLFNQQGANVVNLGGLGPGGPRIPLTIDSPTHFHFTVPQGAVTGLAFLQAINPPYIEWSSTGFDPHGGFMLTAP